MTESETSFAKFSSAETADITKVSQVRQRVLRHQKMFDRGAPYGISELAFFLIVDVLAKRGFSLAAASHIANHCSVTVADFAVDIWAEANGTAPLRGSQDMPRFLAYTLPTSGRPRAFQLEKLQQGSPPFDDDQDLVPAHVVLDFKCLGEQIATAAEKPLVLSNEVSGNG